MSGWLLPVKFWLFVIRYKPRESKQYELSGRMRPALWVCSAGKSVCTGILSGAFGGHDATFSGHGKTVIGWGEQLNVGVV